MAKLCAALGQIPAVPNYRQVSWRGGALVSICGAKIVPGAAPENSSSRQLIGKFSLNDPRGLDSLFWLSRETVMNVNGSGR